MYHVLGTYQCTLCNLTQMHEHTYRRCGLGPKNWKRWTKWYANMRDLIWTRNWLLVCEQSCSHADNLRSMSQFRKWCKAKQLEFQLLKTSRSTSPKAEETSLSWIGDWETNWKAHGTKNFVRQNVTKWHGKKPSLNLKSRWSWTRIKNSQRCTRNCTPKHSTIGPLIQKRTREWCW